MTLVDDKRFPARPGVEEPEIGTRDRVVRGEHDVRLEALGLVLLAWVVELILGNDLAGWLSVVHLAVLI